MPFMHSKAKDLRELFRSKKIVRIVGAHHGLGAKLIERNGFDGIWASGLEISTSYAVPDANILTMTEYLHAGSVMNDAVSIPVICDCDTGYGNSSNVQHMIKKYEAAGIAAAVIEDKIFPKVNSFVPGRQDLASIEEFMGKIEAAKKTQKNPDFMVFARVEALIAGWGLEEALRRAYAYAEAGADGIVIHSKAKTPDEIFEFASNWKSPIPLVVIPTTFYGTTADTFAKRGFKMVIYANQGLRASMKAMDETFKSIHDTGSTALVEKKISSMKEVFEIQGMPELKENEERFSKKTGIQAVIPAAGDPRRLHSGFSEILNDKPLCMLEIGGKTLIDRQVDILRSCEVKDIYVIGGYQADKIKAESTKMLKNPNYSSSGTAWSIMSAKDYLKNQCVVIYSDIIFDRLILDQLLSSPHAITLVIDRAYRTLPPREKKLDLVIAEDLAKDSRSRRLELNTFKRVLEVGQQIDRQKANYEFIGMVFFREEGLSELTEAWQALPSPEKADLNDLLQHLIDRGVPVHGLEIEHGWSELHSIEDFKRVKAHFEKNSGTLVSN